MNTIWKYPLDIGPQVITLTKGFKVLDVQTQEIEGDRPVMWVLHDPEVTIKGAAHLQRLRDRPQDPLRPGCVRRHISNLRREPGVPRLHGMNEMLDAYERESL
jgi:hypothetical protein